VQACAFVFCSELKNVITSHDGHTRSPENSVKRRHSLFTHICKNSSVYPYASNNSEYIFLLCQEWMPSPHSKRGRVGPRACVDVLAGILIVPHKGDFMPTLLQRPRFTDCCVLEKVAGECLSGTLTGIAQFYRGFSYSLPTNTTIILYTRTLYPYKFLTLNHFSSSTT
jgi:hypothetical protein